MEFTTWHFRTETTQCIEKLLMPASRGWRTLHDQCAQVPDSSRIVSSFHPDWVPLLDESLNSTPLYFKNHA